VNTKLKRYGWRGALAGLGLMAATVSGCQTYVPGAGLTLPSGHYLEHLPTYTPPSPFYPNTRELATQQLYASQAAAAAAEGLPPQVPAAGGGVP
jgi:hypothetical protein